VLKEVPPDATVVGIPGRVVLQGGKKVEASAAGANVDLNHNNMPDPVAEMLTCMQRKIMQLEQRMEEFEEEKTHRGNQSI
jgi:serine O-acetyltransferase